MSTESAAAHHAIGPSSQKNKAICPGWVNDPYSDKTRADEGTDLHEATEKGRTDGLTPEQAEQVTKCLNYVKTLEQGAIEVRKEVRLSILGGKTFGTADRLIKRKLNAKIHADVIDFKFGWKAVDDAKDNIQGFNYVLGASELWPEVDSFKVHFLSPRRDEVSTHTFFRSDLARLRLVVATIIDRVLRWEKTKDDSMLNLDEANCMYCGRKADGSCPRILQFALTHAKSYAPLEVAEEVHSSQISDPVAMSRFFTAIRVLEKMVDSGKKHVAEYAKTQDIPGYVRRERAGKVSINNSLLAWPVLKEKLGITSLDDPAFMELVAASTFSYSDIQKIVSGRAARGDKSKAIGALWAALQDADAVRAADPIPYLQRVKDDAPVEV